MPSSAYSPIIVPTDQASIYDALNSLVLANGVAAAILRPNNPPPGVAGFVFDVIDEDSIRLSSDITSYNTSSNNSVQDHIALQPEEVTIGGSVAEVVYSVTQDQPTRPIRNPLPIIQGYTPPLLPQAMAYAIGKVSGGNPSGSYFSSGYNTNVYNASLAQNQTLSRSSGSFAESIVSSPQTVPSITGYALTSLANVISRNYTQTQTILGQQPSVTNQALAAAKPAQPSATGADSTNSLWAYYNQQSPQQPNQTRQSLVANYIYQLWKGRQLFTIETPWGYFTSMAISGVSITQGAESKWTSQIQVTFKKVRFAQTLKIQTGLLAGRAFDQQSTVAQTGTIGQQTLTAQQTAQVSQQMTNPSP